MADTSTIRTALKAARRAKAIAASGEFDEDVVRLLLERVEHELEAASAAQHQSRDTEDRDALKAA